jgi:hypothetical protein
MICAPTALLESKQRGVAPKIAVPNAFAHKIREPSELQSQTGHRLVAASANRAGSRGSLRGPNSDCTIGM